MSFVETVFEHIKARPKRALLIEMHGEQEVPTTNRSLEELIARARGTLPGRGVAAGERVVLLGPNSARWAAADLAILAEGAVTVPMYARQQPAELVEMMHDCEPKVVVVADQTLSDAVRAHWPRAPIVLYERFFRGEAVREPPITRKPSQAVTIIYTSGTSGVAKGVVLSRANVEYMLPVTRDALVRLMGQRDGDDRVFHYLPCCFAGSRIVLWTCLFRDNPIHLSTNLDNLKVEFTSARPHYFLNVPALLERIRAGVEDKIRKQGIAVHGVYQAARSAYARQVAGRPRRLDGFKLALARSLIFNKVRQGIGPDLECLICGSAPLGEETQRWFELLGIPVYQVYGLTETTAIVTMNEPRASEPGYVGHAVPGCEMKVTEEGELLVKGPNVFAGYWNRPEETKKALRDGWFHTGDAAEVNERDNWRIVGRTKNVLVPSSGHNIAPEPIEQQLVESIMGVEHAVVFGHGKPFLTAVISGSVNEAQVEDALDEINGALPHYRRVRKFHITAEPFSPENGLLTANQKLKRRSLEAHFAGELSRMYS